VDDLKPRRADFLHQIVFAVSAEVPHSLVQGAEELWSGGYDQDAPSAFLKNLVEVRQDPLIVSNMLQNICAKDGV